MLKFFALIRFRFRTLSTHEVIFVVHFEHFDLTDFDRYSIKAGKTLNVFITLLL